MRDHHPVLQQVATEMMSLEAAGRLDRPAFDALLQRAMDAGLSRVECFPLYQSASHLGLVNITDYFPPKGRVVEVPYGRT